MTAYSPTLMPEEVLSWIMSDEPKAVNGSESGIQSTAQAIAALAKEVPIYQDALQPGAKEIGEGLGGLLAAMMVPLQMLGFASRKYVQEFKDRYEEKAAAIPAGRLTPPDPMIMGPTLQALTYTAQEPDLREMFVSLLASASDSVKAEAVHPSFVEVVRQLSPRDAKLLQSIVKLSAIAICKIRNEDREGSGNDIVLHILQLNEVDDLNSYATSIENLERLRIFTIDYGMRFKQDDHYASMEQKIKTVYPDAIFHHSDRVVSEGMRPVIYRGVVNLTEYGKDFARSCLQ